jgi:hypothetical protein
MSGYGLLWCPCCRLKERIPPAMCCRLMNLRICFERATAPLFYKLPMPSNSRKTNSWQKRQTRQTAGKGQKTANCLVKSRAGRVRSSRPHFRG